MQVFPLLRHGPFNIVPQPFFVSISIPSELRNYLELETEDKLEYRFVPTGNGVVNFKVRAPNDAHIALTTNPEESDPMLEVFIGGWKNTKSVIRKNRTKPDVAEVETPDILNAGEFRGFWIRWQDNVSS